jgi:hypothetical protein
MPFTLDVIAEVNHKRATRYTYQPHQLLAIYRSLLSSHTYTDPEAGTAAAKACIHRSSRGAIIIKVLVNANITYTVIDSPGSEVISKGKNNDDARDVYSGLATITHFLSSLVRHKVSTPLLADPDVRWDAIYQNLPKQVCTDVAFLRARRTAVGCLGEQVVRGCTVAHHVHVFTCLGEEVTWKVDCDTGDVAGVGAAAGAETKTPKQDRKVDALERDLQPVV